MTIENIIEIAKENNLKVEKTSPASPSYKCEVNGKIHARRIRTVAQMIDFYEFLLAQAELGEHESLKSANRIEGAKDSLQFSRAPRLSSHEKMSARQISALAKFAKQFGSSVKELAPYIDLCFKVWRYDITLEEFEKTTGVKLQYSTYNDHSMHNL